MRTPELPRLLVVRRAVESLGLKPGDVVSVHLGAEEPIVVHRAVNLDVQALAVAVFDMGALVGIDALDSVVTNRARSSTETAAASDAIDVDAALCRLADPDAKAPAERLGAELLTGKTLSRFAKTRDRIQRQKVCRTCRTEFIGRDGNAVYCPSCRAERRRRCVSCGEAFNAGASQSKRCEQCLRQAAKAGEAVAIKALRAARGHQ